MKTVYEAASAIEAHMLVDLLQHEGIEAQVRGEALQGAMGEIPATGLVRLEVDEADHAAARRVIAQWEQTQVEPTPAPARPPRSGLVRGVVIGLVLGVAATYAAYRAPLRQDGVDYNGDGQLDERWTYSANGMPLKYEIDRNLDGKIDYVATYDARGFMDSAEADDNFDGVFESHQWLHHGSIQMSATDTDGDGYPDLRTNYNHGVTDSVEFIHPASGKPLRVEHYALGVLKHADIDSDRDGTLDTRLRYSPLGEITAREALPAPATRPEASAR